LHRRRWPDSTTLARYLGVAAIRVKDESKRCGLNAFKVLGASFALSTCLAHKLELDPEEVTFNFLEYFKGLCRRFCGLSG
jgi:threonine dehydratase